MDITSANLTERYRAMPDAELLERFAPDKLTDVAREVLLKEITRRGLPLPDMLSAPLIADPPAEPEDSLFIDQEANDSLTMVTLRRYLNILEAKIHCELLKSENIAAFVADEWTAQSYNYIANAIGGVRLQVPGSQLQRAREILAEVHTGQRTASAEALYHEGTLSEDRISAATVTMDEKQYRISMLCIVGLVALLSFYLAYG